MSIKFTVVSMQTYGDYLLKAPFIHELFAAQPKAEITVVTNSKGAQVYPLIDSRLAIVTVGKTESRIAILARLRRLPRADALYLLDQHPASCLFAMLIPARQRIGWYQSVSRLYHGPEAGFRDRYTINPILSGILKLALDKKYLRSPESLYEGHVELGLLESPQLYPRLSQYRTAYSFPRNSKADPPLIFCATLASWIARQLDEDIWTQIITTVSTDFPGHRIVVDASDSLMSRLAVHTQVSRLVRSTDLRDFFRLVSSATLVIAPDSFVTHLASWFDVPAISYFGPASPHRFAPTAPRSTILYHRPPCSPCVQQGGKHPCLAGYTECLSLQMLSVGEIAAGTTNTTVSCRKSSSSSRAK